MEELLVEAAKSGGQVEALLRSPVGRECLDKMNSSEVTALHMAIWQNHHQLVDTLLQAGADVQVQDGESGWTPLHRALYLGHLCTAQRLLRAGAPLAEPLDRRGRSPPDLLSAARQAQARALRGRPPPPGDSSLGLLHPDLLQPGSQPVGVVWSAGCGANYQLGTGSTDMRPLPGRVEALTGVGICALAAAKFHSAALDEQGRVWTWGFGRGGRLGHPDLEVVGGASAQIVPRCVAGLGRRQVVAVAAAKHHMLAATRAGELFSWGSNKHGQLGSGSGNDSQPVPRKVTALRQRVVAVAAANKHSAVLTAAGECFTFGANGQGQLGYGSCDSACAPAPRLVEGLKGRLLTGVSASKRHTVVMSQEGEVWTWGHKVVTPRKVLLSGARDMLRAAASSAATAPPTASSPVPGSSPLQVSPLAAAVSPAAGAPSAAAAAAAVRFHRGHAQVARPCATALAVGLAHSSVLTDSGTVMVWRSADPSPLLCAREVTGPLAGKTVVSISAGKTRTAAVTSEGDLYVWEGVVPGGAGEQPGSGGLAGGGRGGSLLPGAVPAGCVEVAKVPGLKRVASVAVGEKHTLALQRWWRPPLGPSLQLLEQGGAGRQPAGDGTDSGEEEQPLEGSTRCREQQQQEEQQCAGSGTGCGVASLQELCQRVLASQMVEPRSVLPVLEYADVAGASLLRAFCLSVALSNLELLLLEARPALERLPGHLMAEMEHHVRQGLATTSSLVLPRAAAVGAQGVPGGRQAAASSTGGGRTAGGLVLSWQLQPGMRPTGPPAWLAGANETDRLLPQVGARLAAAAALAAQQGSPASGSSSGSVVGRPQTSAFTSGDSDPGGSQEQQAADKLLRTIERKLAQIAALEERCSAGSSLDVQQAAKVGQKGSLQQALAALLAGVAAAEVQAMMEASQAVAAKLAAVAAAASPPPASASGGGGSSSSSRQQAAARQAGARKKGSRQGSREPSSSDLVALASSPPDHPSPSSPPPVASQETAAARRSLASPSPSSGPSLAMPMLQAASSSCGAEPTLRPQWAAQMQPAPSSTTPPSSSNKKPAARKGGLSMFLAGALELPAQQTQHASSAAAKQAAAWGSGASKAPSSQATASSLRDIFEEQRSLPPPLGFRPGSSPPASGRGAAAGGLASAPGTPAAAARPPFTQLPAGGYSPLVQPTLGGRATRQSIVHDSLQRPPAPQLLEAAGASPAVPAPSPPAAATVRSRTDGSSASLCSSPPPPSFTSKLQLAHFLAQPPSKPLPVAQAAGKPGKPTASGTAWGGAAGLPGSSPGVTAAGPLSLKDIQSQQQAAAAAVLAWGPGSMQDRHPLAASRGAMMGSSPGSAAVSASGSSWMGHAAPGQLTYGCKWYVPEPAARASLSAIQTEELLLEEARRQEEALAAAHRAAGRSSKSPSKTEGAPGEIDDDSGGQVKAVEAGQGGRTPGRAPRGGRGKKAAAKGEEEAEGKDKDGGGRAQRRRRSGKAGAEGAGAASSGGATARPRSRHAAAAQTTPGATTSADVAGTSSAVSNAPAQQTQVISRTS